MLGFCLTHSQPRPPPSALRGRCSGMQGKVQAVTNCPLESSVSLEHAQPLAGRCVWRRDAKRDYGQHQRCWVNVTQIQDFSLVQTLGVDELSTIVRQSRAVVLRTLRLHPDRLPLPARRVGRNYIWLPADVENWLKAGSCSATNQTSLGGPAPAQKRGRGRPRKEVRLGGEK